MHVLSRSTFKARGPVPPWWRRPGVLAVVALLVVGTGLASYDAVTGLVASREVREVSHGVRAMPLPESFEEWQAACGTYGLRCARTELAPAEAVEAIADVLRQLGHELEPARCGADARVDPGTTLVSVPRHDSQCTTTTSVAGGELTVAAWDHVPAVISSGEPFALGRTAVVVEWDAEGTDHLLVAEPGLEAARFADVRITAEEVAELPGALAEAECTGEDADGCLAWATTLVGPGDGRALVEAWARELGDAGFLVVSLECDPDPERRLCSLLATRGRGAGEATQLGVWIDLDATQEGHAFATVSTA